MDVIGKTKAVMEWAREWPELDGYLKLNAIDAETVGDSAVMPISNERSEREYIDGTADRVFTMGLRRILSWSDGFDGINEEAVRLMESWMDWVANQYPRNVPDLGGGATVTAIEPVQNMPEPSMIYADSQTAEYSFLARIHYTE